MADMAQWPTSRGMHAVIAVMGAAAASIGVFIWTNNTHFERYAREYPHDGQDGLSAFMDALFAGGWTFIGVSIGLFLLLRMTMGIRNSE
jgi:hypothetical protein